MSGLIDSIVRRRRASASSRLGPPPAPAAPYSNGVVQEPVNGAHANGVSAPAGVYHALQAVAPPEAPETVAEPEAAALAPPAAPETITEPAAPAEPEAADLDEASSDEPEPGFRERGRIQRRARYLRRLRELQLRDIGGFMVELHRFQRERPDLVRAKVEDAARVDSELRELQRALALEHPVRELREAGIGGACENCGAVHGSEDRFCASCGEPLDADREIEDDGAPEHSAQT